MQGRAGEEDGVQQPGSGGGGRPLLSHTGPPLASHINSCIVASSLPDPHVSGLPDPDPLVRVMDPDPDPSIIVRKALILTVS